MHVRAGRDRNVLFPFGHVSHGRSAERLVRVEVPKRLAILRIHRCERSAIVAQEQNTSGRRQHAARAAAGTELRNFPGDLAGLNVDRAQEFLSRLTGYPASAAAVERLPRLPPRRRFHIDVAGLQRHHIKQLGRGIECRRHPVRRAAHRRTGLGSLRSRLLAGQELGPAVGTDAAGPVQLLDERFCHQKFARHPVENVKKAIAIRLHQQLSRPPRNSVSISIGVSVASQSCRSCGLNW